MDTIELNKRIDGSGIKKVFIIKALGLSKQGFYNKINGLSPFTLDEVKELSNILKLSSKDTMRIFLQ